MAGWSAVDARRVRLLRLLRERSCCSRRLGQHVARPPKRVLCDMRWLETRGLVDRRPGFYPIVWRITQAGLEALSSAERLGPMALRRRAS